MNTERFYEVVKGESPMYSSEIQGLRELIAQHPYFQQATFLYLRALYNMNTPFYDEELERLSIFIHDRQALFYFIFEREFQSYFKISGKKEMPIDKTSILLDTFFETKKIEGQTNNLPYESDNATLATSDYFTFLSLKTDTKETSDKTENPLKHHDIIDSFIEKSESEGIQFNLDEPTDGKEANQQKVNISSELDDDVFFTETLAKIYIKQKRYDKAYKIIKHLNLKYPKKNSYFADQLKFLEKLIINTKYKDKK